MLDRLTYEYFKKCCGKTFTLVRGSAGRSRLSVLDVRRSPYPGLPEPAPFPSAILFTAARQSRPR